MPASEPVVAVSEPLEGAEGRDLLVLLHGRGADERDLLPVAARVAPHAVAIAPRAPVPYGPGFAWAPPDEDVCRGHDLHLAARDVLHLIEGVLSERQPARVQVLGFSQGGAVALALLQIAPERFSQVVVLAGFVPERTAVAPAPRATPVFWGRGAEDPNIAPEAIERTSTWLSGTSATVSVYPDLGHALSAAELSEVRDFLLARPSEADA